jgi:hypothetical protein
VTDVVLTVGWLLWMLFAVVGVVTTIRWVADAYRIGGRVDEHSD